MPKIHSIRPVRTLFCLLFAVAAAHCGGGAGTPQQVGGGTLKASYRAEPTNYIRMVVPPTAPNHTLSLLTQLTLVRTSPKGEVEPRVAQKWTVSPDGLTWTVDLHPDAKFSDGTPLTSADVVFSLAATEGLPAAGDFMVDGTPVTARALDAHRVAFVFPAPYGPGMAMFDTLFILPRHKLEAARAEHRLPTVWTVGTPPAEIVGAGPFIVKEHVPGQRFRFERNPHYFLKDAEGRALPYLDAIDFTIIPEYDAEMARLLAGETDVITDAAAPDDLASLQAAAKDGRIQLADAGPAIDVTTWWFDLSPRAQNRADKPWLQKPEFRKALSHAINRQAIVDTVYFGQALPAYGPVTAGHGPWYVPDLPTTPYDQGRAKALLAEIGLTDRNGDGRLEDERGRPVRFSVLNRSGLPDRERTLAIAQEHLRQIGIDLDIVNLSAQELGQRMGNHTYEAMYFGGRAPSAQPNASFWMSQGSFHYWHPGQTSPSTPWEARIDQLFREQARTMDGPTRVRVFSEMQRLLADNLPAVWFVAPRVIIPVSGRVNGAVPRIFFPPILWNADRLSVSSGGQ